MPPFCGFASKPFLAILTKSQPTVPVGYVAIWCNWLTRRPLKAKSSGSSPDIATT